MSEPRFHRRSIRLRGYDYSRAGAYFVTICAHQRQCLFGEVVDQEMHLNRVGQIVADEWARTPNIRSNVELGEWVVMPNHFHGIIVLTENCVVVPDGRGVSQYAPTMTHAPTGAITQYAPTGAITPSAPTGAITPSAPTGAITPSAPTGDTTPSAPVVPQTDAPRKLRSPSQTVGAIVRGFESSATKQINIYRNRPGVPVWQRNYWDHIIRDEQEFDRISQYIANNPARWNSDSLRDQGIPDGDVVREPQTEYSRDEWMT